MPDKIKSKALELEEAIAMANLVLQQDIDRFKVSLIKN
jgi:hypothetical protein